MFPTDASIIQLSDGRAKEIRFTLRTFKVLKDRFGVSFLNGEGWKKIDEEMLPVVIYEALVDKTGIDAEQIADLISVDSLPEVMTAIAKAINGNKAKEPQEETDQKKV